MQQFNINRATLLASILTPIALFTYLFKSLLYNLDSALFDWNDYPLYVWIIQQHVRNITALNIHGFFDGRIFFPDPLTLLFSDLFLPQSVVSALFSFIFNNPITQFNIIFFLTIIANALCIYYFWSAVLQTKSAVFFAALSTNFSAFVLHNWVHFQIFGSWPLFLLFGWVARIRAISTKSAIISGILFSIVFYSSIYYWVIGIFALCVWFALLCLSNSSSIDRKKVVEVIQYFLITISMFLLLSGYTLYKYGETRQLYQAQRAYSEYVTYAADPFDYIFPPHTSSLFWHTSFGNKWMSYAKRSGVFPGFAVSILAVMGFWAVQRRKSTINFSFTTDQHSLFFFTLAITGLVFSLGPRLIAFGNLTSIPLPYHLLLVGNPFFEVVRVTSRWSILFFIALSFFAGKGIEKLAKPKQFFVACAASALFLIEVYPTPVNTVQKNYYQESYQPIHQACRQTSQVLLEYPITEFADQVDIVSNLTYRTQMMLASTIHGCTLVNGYSGFIPREFEQYDRQLFTSVENSDELEFWNLLRTRGVQFLKLNKTHLYPDRVERIDTWLHNQSQATILYSSSNHTVAKINQ